MSKSTQKGLSEPTQTKLIRRRRCALETCNQLFRPKTKWQRFCCLTHKSDYHFKSPTFRKFEDEIKGLIRKMVKQEALK